MTDKWLTEIADEIMIEDLPGDYREIANAIGVKNTLQLVPCIGGLQLYFPKMEAYLVARRDARIRREFTGNNYRELAIRYGLSERWIRAIVQQKPEDEKQTSLF